MFGFLKKKVDWLAVDTATALSTVILNTQPDELLSRFKVKNNPLTIARGNEGFIFNTATADKIKTNEATVRIVVNNEMTTSDIYGLFLPEVQKAVGLFSGIVKMNYDVRPCGANFIGQIYIEGVLKETP